MATDNSKDILTQRIGKTACGSCRAVLDVSDMEPFSTMTCPQCQFKFSVPGKLGVFTLLKCLGKGGMGATYKGIDSMLKRPVAVKVMRRSLAENPRFAEEFLREARSLASLNHPNVIHVYSLGRENDQPYIVMELADGGQMNTLFGPDRPMDEVQALDLVIGIAEGLKATSAIGLVHGDVKPENILLDAEGTPKLVDFGIARLEASHAPPGEIIGSPYYLSPEAGQCKPIDFRADIYSLGATLFHALTGRPPFEGNSVKEIVTAKLSRRAPDIRELRWDVCDQTAGMVARMLEIDPEMRHSSYDDLLGELFLAHKVASRIQMDKYLAEQMRQAHASRAPGWSAASKGGTRRGAGPRKSGASIFKNPVLIIGLALLVTIFIAVIVMAAVLSK